MLWDRHPFRLGVLSGDHVILAAAENAIDASPLLKQPHRIVAQTAADERDMPGADFQHFVATDLQSADAQACRFFHGSRKHDFTDAGPVAGAQAHGAWFASGVENASFQVNGIQPFANLPNYLHLRVRGDIHVGINRVMTTSQHLITANNTGSDRRLIPMNGSAGFFQRQAHKMFVEGHK